MSGRRRRLAVNELLPALPVTADTRSITERVNVLIRDYNTLLGVPAGCVMPYAGATAPDGWLLCHGQAVSRTTYADLFAAIGTAYGAGDGSTTFNLPDLRGRVAAGRDDMGGTDAGRLAGGVADRTTLGGAGGAATHTLGTGEMPAHSHGVNDPGHAHSLCAGQIPSRLHAARHQRRRHQLQQQCRHHGAHRHLHPERRRRRRAQQHAADPRPQLRDRHMILLRQGLRGTSPPASCLPRGLVLRSSAGAKEGSRASLAAILASVARRLAVARAGRHAHERRHRGRGRPDVAAGDAQLWGVFDGDEMIAAVTTQITLIGEKGCRLWLVGGSYMAEWAADFLAKVEPWARSLRGPF